MESAFDTVQLLWDRVSSIVFDIVLDALVGLVILDEHESVARIFQVLLRKLVLDLWAAEEDHVEWHLC